MVRPAFSTRGILPTPPRPDPRSCYPGCSPRWTNMKPADKHFRCTICQRGFTRIDHLKRHHLRRMCPAREKPGDVLKSEQIRAKSPIPASSAVSHLRAGPDNLRDHYTDCAKRGDRKIPETGQRGRRRHACQSCTSMKLRCDGQSPCGSCQKRGLDCNNERTALPKHSELDEGTPSRDLVAGRVDSSPSGSPSTKPEMYEQPSDRGSIKFLLNGGTDSFTEQFQLPPHADRARGFVYHNQNGLEGKATGIFPYNVEDNRTGYPPAMIDSDPATLQFFQDTFLDFFNGPFGDPNKALENPYTGEITYQAVVPPGQDPNLAMPAEPAIFEPEQPFALALIQSILARAWTIPLDAKAQEDLTNNLNFLLTTARIRKYISLYFQYWDPSCSMLHFPSFDPGAVSLPLLASVVFMGAMYTTDQRESFVAKKILDFAELFIFSSDIFSAENEIVTVFSGNECYEDEPNDWVKFQNFQAGFIMTVVQYWAGSRVSRNRSMENRFSEVVKVARRIGLVKCRHLPNDPALEHSWIQKECRIRTVAIVSLLDCAFFFFQNYPCRLTHSEMECDFPCDDSVWRSEHPFAEPNFRFTRDLTISDAFQYLFDDASKQDSPYRSPERNTLDLTVLDMFILIHLLFAFINTHMTLLGPFIRSHSKKTAQAVSGGVIGKSLIPEDSILGAIRAALGRWRDHWEALRNQVPSDQWASMGFYKNGYNFWLVSQLLITKKDAVDVVMRMEVHCEDKLGKLRVLLLDEKD
ncbi:transcriptional regulator family: Fungal Specific TF [Penicillium alfredii]|uniref:Transcriptional regulator family: Fungal Specific TF n=1 Tax=Penicillium alfredii TaxID=1506179 RepID=A0A9W9F2Q2_9EURO|nr:transcriptional regulator family: Fungal Specific TF [Penicillium alfredii]KAJ5092481.1 transcriptional regulator family: Fungal Specific TF [Penicillium alfredii]